jgi:hypothetical protein
VFPIPTDVTAAATSISAGTCKEVDYGRMVS